MLKPGGVLLDAEAIKQAVSRIAGELNEDYKEEGFYGLIVLKGGFVFASDLIRCLSCPVETGFMYSSSYCGTERRSESENSGIVAPEKIRGKRVVIIEDIIDTGGTCRNLMGMVEKHSPRDIRLCALLVKPGIKGHDFAVDYKGFEIPDRFVVGYGLDYCEMYRELPDIRILEES